LRSFDPRGDEHRNEPVPGAEFRPAAIASLAVGAAELDLSRMASASSETKDPAGGPRLCRRDGAVLSNVRFTTGPNNVPLTPGAFIAEEPKLERDSFSQYSVHIPIQRSHAFTAF
jgi:hypothetical protein